MANLFDSEITCVQNLSTFLLRVVNMIYLNVLSMLWSGAIWRTKKKWRTQTTWMCTHVGPIIQECLIPCTEGQPLLIHAYPNGMFRLKISHVRYVRPRDTLRNIEVLSRLYPIPVYSWTSRPVPRPVSYRPLVQHTPWTICHNCTSSYWIRIFCERYAIWIHLMI